MARRADSVRLSGASALRPPQVTGETDELLDSPSPSKTLSLPWLQSHGLGRVAMPAPDTLQPGQPPMDASAHGGVAARGAGSGLGRP